MRKHDEVSRHIIPAYWTMPSSASRMLRKWMQFSFNFVEGLAVGTAPRSSCRSRHPQDAPAVLIRP